MSAKWFICQNERVMGPLSTDQVERQLESMTIETSDLIWGHPLKHWTTLSDWQEKLPTLGHTVELMTPAEQWHYALNGKAHGPFDRAELVRELKATDQALEAMVWTRGMKEWAPLTEFHDLLSDVGVNKRIFPRATLSGQAVLKGEGLTLMAPLLTISEGGLSVQLETGLVSGQMVTVEIQSSVFRSPIVARAEVRYGADGIVGLRFSNLPADSKMAIVQFVRQGQNRAAATAA